MSDMESGTQVRQQATTSTIADDSVAKVDESADKTALATTSTIAGDSVAEAQDCVDEAEDSLAVEGDFVILWGSYTQISGVMLKHGAIFNNRYGNFHHDDLIGQRFGSKVNPKNGGGWLALLRSTPELITQSLMHRTQIIYHADISLLMMLLDCRPGKVFVEAGTGSGSVSTSLARGLRPGGRLHTFEFHADRQRLAAEDFKRYGLDDTIISAHGDVCANGFGDSLDGCIDGIFLDLPMPWLAIPHVSRGLKSQGKICTFSPCIEQIDKTAAELRRFRFRDIRMFETLAVNWAVKTEGPPKRRKVSKEATKDTTANKSTENISAFEGDKATTPAWLSYQMPMRGHTGYLMVASKAPPPAN